jgi:hypothetical protein
MTDFHFPLLNGNKKVTVIETFDSRALILSPGERLEFPSLDKCKDHIIQTGFEISISHIFGSSIQREIQKAKGVEK